MTPDELGPLALARRRLGRVATVGVAVALLVAPWPWGALAVASVLAARVGGAAIRRRGATGALPRRHAVAGRLPWRRRAPASAVALGHDARGRAVTLTDGQLSAHALIVGASGAGKSTTLLAVLADRIARGDPVVAIDMKGSPAFAAAVADAARGAGRGLRVWTPDGPSHWNPLAHGGPTALKDKLISAERFSEPHYRRAAERYLQSALQVLCARHPERAPTLPEVVGAMEPGRLRALATELPGPLGERVADYVANLTDDQRNAAAGLGTRLALLAESDAGRWLAPPDAGPTIATAGGRAGAPGTASAAAASTIDLGAALTGGDVVLFSINSSVYGALGAHVGALAVQDLTSAAGRRLAAGAHGAGAAGAAGAGAAGDPPRRPATIALDEFSALGADNVLALLARGREAGASVLLATQELSDLERAGRGFRDQVLGITAVTLAHRQEVHESAQAIAQMAGTRMVWRETRPVGGLGAAIADGIAAGAGGRGGRPGAGSRATRREHEEPVVHPNAIKRLGTGELVLITHVPRPTATRVRVSPVRSTQRGDRGGQAAPGVTR